ncbi:hypothetical protein D3C75_508090 [compost metagenome]
MRKSPWLFNSCTSIRSVDRHPRPAKQAVIRSGRLSLRRTENPAQSPTSKNPNLRLFCLVSPSRSLKPHVRRGQQVPPMLWGERPARTLFVCLVGFSLLQMVPTRPRGNRSRVMPCYGFKGAMGTDCRRYWSTGTSLTRTVTFT